MMNVPDVIRVDYLESRLGGRLPLVYKSFAQAHGPESLTKRGFDPKTLLVLNLELREMMGPDHAAGRFFLNGDGCGNYYFAELQEDAETVLLWSHDPPGIEEPGHLLASYLDEAEQECRIDRPAPPGQSFICRTAHYAESILDPIGLDEWIAAVRATEGIQYLGYWEAPNPFSRETMRVEAPGLAELVGQKRIYLRFGLGRASFDASPALRPVAIALARKLGANVVGI